MAKDLTPEESEELGRAKIGSVDGPLAPARLAVRREIARKQFEARMETEWWAQLSAESRALYDAYPPWKFYSRAGGAALRIYGVDVATGSLRTASISYLGVERGTTPPSPDIVPVEDWTRRQKAVIGMCCEPSTFYDPCAWAFT